MEENTLTNTNEIRFHMLAELPENTLIGNSAVSAIDAATSAYMKFILDSAIDIAKYRLKDMIEDG